MLVTCVHVWVKQGNIQDFIEASRKNHEGSIQEPGNLRFDILQSSEDPCRFLLYEAYDSEEAAAAHKNTEHYLAWRKTVAEWMEKPREGVPYRMLCPSSSHPC
jgi:autoinducer 2-degrading protein